jgi:hypothetical protein
MEVESGFIGSCRGVCVAFGSVALKVVGSAERSVKGTTTVVGVAVGWRVVRAQSSRGVSRQRASIHGRRGSGHVSGRCSSIVCLHSASASNVFCGSLKAFLRWGYSRSGVIMASSSTSAVCVGSTVTVDEVFCNFVFGRGLGVVSTRLCTFSLSHNTDMYYKKKLCKLKHAADDILLPA